MKLLYVICAHSLVALDADTGDEVWRQIVGMTLHPSFPVVTADAVVVWGPVELFCFDRVSGAVRWKVPASYADANAHLVVVDDRVVVGSRGVVRAWSLSTGAPLWEAGLKGLGYGAVRLGRAAKSTPSAG